MVENTDTYHSYRPPQAVRVCICAYYYHNNNPQVLDLPRMTEPQGTLLGAFSN